MKIEQNKQKWQAHEEANKQSNEQGPSQQQESDLGFAVRKETKKELQRQESSKGIRIKELVTNTAEFPVPSYDETVDWDDNSWKKYASPLELDDYYSQHPEERPANWVPVRSSLKSREEDDRELAEEQQKKIEEGS